MRARFYHPVLSKVIFVAGLAMVCSVGLGSADHTWLVVFGVLCGLGFSCFVTEAGDDLAGDDFAAIERQRENLAHLEATLKAKYAQKGLSQEEFKQKMQKIFQERKKLQSKLDDTVMAMMVAEGSKEVPQETAVDPLAAQMQEKKEAQEESQKDRGRPQVNITAIQRGLLKDARALEIRFLFRGKQCKAVITSDKGEWHFSTHGETLYLVQFLRALQESKRFADVFAREVRRHPDDWHDVVVEGKSYTKKDKERNSRDNFPEVCKQILKQQSMSKSKMPSDTAVARVLRNTDLTGKRVVIHRVANGEYTKTGRQDFGKGFLEFPRYIMVTFDWGEYRLKAEITTNKGQWEVIPRDPSEDYPRESLKKFPLGVPFLVQELELPRNKYLAHTMLTEMRIKEHRHQWEIVVKGSPALHFPRVCKELFSEEYQ